MVYSTCTFNPIEDEAVVGELLLRCGGSLELLDVSDQLPKLKRMPGLTQWKVKDRHQFYDTWEEAEKVSCSSKQQHKYSTHSNLTSAAAPGLAYITRRQLM